jgi:hypothetical protein
MLVSTEMILGMMGFISFERSGSPLRFEFTVLIPMVIRTGLAETCIRVK